MYQTTADINIYTDTCSLFAAGWIIIIIIIIKKKK